MHYIDRLDFIIRSLGLSHTDVASACDIDRSFLSNICAGRYNPSIDVSLKIDTHLKSIWVARKGETVPPEVAEIVFKLLYPPPPFNPFDGGPKRGPGRPKKGFSPTVGQNPPAEDSHASDNSDKKTVAAALEQHESEGENQRTIASQTLGNSAHLGSQVLPAIRSPRCDYSVLSSAGRAWQTVAYQSRAAREAFIDACFEQHWAQRWSPIPNKAGVSPRRDKIVRALNDAAGIKIRQRSKDADVQAKRESIFSIIAPAIASHRSRNVHSKGAQDKHAWGSNKSTVQAVLDQEPIKEALKDSLGEVPSLEYCLGLLREKWGKVDSYADAKDHLQRTIGFRPAYAGHVLLADATGIPVEIEAPFGRKHVGTRGNKNGFQKHWLHLAVDVASAYMWIHPFYSDNEADGWAPFLRWMMLDQLFEVPEFLSVDKVSGVFAPLIDPDVGAFPNVPLELLALMAAGVTPYIHQPERPTGGAHVERAVRLAKDEINYIGVREALKKELSGHGLKAARRFTQAEFVSVINELRGNVNEKFLKRAGDKRRNLWFHEQNIASRSPRAKAANFGTAWRDVVARTKVVSASGSLLIGKSGSQRIVADLTSELDCKPQDWPAYVFPAGLRANDDPEALRVLIVQPRAGIPAFHTAEARASKKDMHGFDERQPIFGTGFKALPDTRIDQLKKIKDESAALHKARVAALREGTSGAPIDTGTNGFSGEFE